jgi:hypothetical protein
MKKNIPFLFSMAVWTLLWTVQVDPALCQSHETAIAFGEAVTTQINCDERAGGIEPYDATLAVEEMTRGAEAWDKANPEPEAGYEYILARISFKMKPRGAPGDKTFDLGRPLQFTAFSENFEEYTTPKTNVPEPALKGRIPANQPAQGWIAVSVKKDDPRPLLMFDPSSGGAWSRGKIIFFRLYP